MIRSSKWELKRVDTKKVVRRSEPPEVRLRAHALLAGLVSPLVGSTFGAVNVLLEPVGLGETFDSGRKAFVVGIVENAPLVGKPPSFNVLLHGCGNPFHAKCSFSKLRERAV